MKSKGFIFYLSWPILSACGGGGNDAGNSNASVDNNHVSPVGGVQGCKSNRVLTNDTCQCPEHLVDKDGYCIDWAESVLVGAEYLEPGFPVAVDLFSGSYYGPLYLKTGNIDKDPELELLFKPGTSYIWAWNFDGSTVDGWPTAASTYSHGKIALVQFDDDEELEVFSGHEGTAQSSNKCELNAFNYNGSLRTGWPVYCDLSIIVTPVADDIDGDGYDEVIYFDNKHLNKVDRNGNVQKIYIDDLPAALNKWCGFSIADINADLSKELILLSCEFRDFSNHTSRKMRRLYVLDSSFQVVDGFPVQFGGGYNHHPVVGDVDGDGNKEIIVAGAGTVAQHKSSGILSSIKIISYNGLIKNEINFTNWIGNGYYHHISLADMDQSGYPEIIVYNNGKIHAFKSSGIELEGWPVEGGEYFAVGDIDGDNKADLVTFKDYSTNFDKNFLNVLAVYNDGGRLKDLDVVIDFMGRGSGKIMPVIADIDLDGRNEVIAIGDYWGSVSGSFPQVWAFDFGGTDHGPIEWGQMFGDPANTGRYSRN